MPTTPPPGGARDPADDRDRQLPPKPVDDTSEEEFELELAAHAREVERRRRLRLHVENPEWFVADSDEASDGPPEIESPVFPFIGKLYLAVRRKYATNPLRDPEARLGVCDEHPLPADVPAEDNPCAYQTSAFFVATSPTELRRTMFAELMLGNPDLSPREVLKSLNNHWRIVELEAAAVRCAWLFGDPALEGGEPQLRHDGQRLASEDASSWRRVRSMLDRDAAIVVLGGDRDGEAQRILLFNLPALALSRSAVQALKWGKPTKFTDYDGWRGLGRGTPLRPPSLPNRQPLVRRVRSDLKFRYRMWRENRRTAKAERIERRDQRRRESAERWAVRGAIIEELRNLVALVREAVETTMVIAKLILIIGVLVGIPAGVTAVVLKLWSG
jgi:hypothetical protein